MYTRPAVSDDDDWERMQETGVGETRHLLTPSIQYYTTQLLYVYQSYLHLPLTDSIHASRTMTSAAETAP